MRKRVLTNVQELTAKPHVNKLEVQRKECTGTLKHTHIKISTTHTRMRSENAKQNEVGVSATMHRMRLA